ncbi:hypothetical protein L9F63_005578, partial [Diploptera punctata]
RHERAREGSMRSSGKQPFRSTGTATNKHHCDTFVDELKFRKLSASLIPGRACFSVGDAPLAFEVSPSPQGSGLSLSAFMPLRSSPFPGKGPSHGVTPPPPPFSSGLGTGNGGHTGYASRSPGFEVINRIRNTVVKIKFGIQYTKTLLLMKRATLSGVIRSSSFVLVLRMRLYSRRCSAFPCLIVLITADQESQSNVLGANTNDPVDGLKFLRRIVGLYSFLETQMFTISNVLSG